jgi:hypothetical protein
MAQSLTKRTQISCTPEQVQDWLSDWDNIKSWMGPSLVSIEMLSDHESDAPMCSGMRFRETRKMGKMNAKAVVEVERHELVDGVLHHKAVFDDGCNRMIAEYAYSPSEAGTLATWSMSNAPNKWWTKAMSVVTGPMMIKMMEKCEGDHMERLKKLIEVSA